MKQWQIFLMLGFFLLVLSSFDSAEGEASGVTIASDRLSADILLDEMAVITLTIEEGDERYRKQEIYLMAVWPDDIAWETAFVDTNYDEIEDNTFYIPKQGSTTVLLLVFCDVSCEAGDTNTMQIFARTDPKFYQSDENATDSCGSSDCKNDTTPASESSNVTNIISVDLTLRMGYASEIACDVVASIGDNVFTQGDTYLWGYTLTNTGWLSDTYQFTSVVTSADGHNVDYWTTSAGIADGRELTGQSDSANSAVHNIEASMSITPATNATSGVYNVELTVVSNNGAPDSGCNFDVVIPGNETEERPTELWTFYRDFVECDPDDNSLVAYGEFVDCLNMDLRNDGESEVNASSEFANEMFSMADLDMDENLTSSEFDYIKFYPHETEESGETEENVHTIEPGGTGEACTGCSAECCEFCADTDGECPYDCVYNEDQSDNPSSCLAPDEGTDIIEEVPSISLISAIAVLGSIVIFRRK